MYVRLTIMRLGIFRSRNGSEMVYLFLIARVLGQLYFVNFNLRINYERVCFNRPVMIYLIMTMVS